MKNNYEVRGDVTSILIKSSKYGDMESLISTNKLQRANEFSGTWFAKYDNDIKSFYVGGNMPMGNGYRKTILLHRWITHAPSNLVCDHVNHNTLDNTDDNLRLITNAENQLNRKGAQCNSSSGIRGVMWSNIDKKWKVRIGKKYIGLFDDIKKAEKAANEAVLKLMPYA